MFYLELRSSTINYTLQIFMLKSIIRNEIEKASKLPYVDKKLLKSFQKRLQQGNLIREESPEDHFCVFIVPVHKKSGQIYLGHHKKANDWIPPGGHIETDETLLEAVKREAQEELGFQITDEKIELYAVDSLDVSHPGRRCKIHHHIWYLLFMDKLVEFNYTKEEFHDAKWLTVLEAINKIRIPLYIKTISKILD